MATNNGKERRRRIIDTGSDRLALIKGRIHDLPSSPSSSPHYSSFKDSPRSTFFSSDNHDQTPQTPLSADQNNINEKDKETTGINNNREERRRRIVDRGSDRLALITGRIQDLPSSPSSLSSTPHFYTFKESPRSTFLSHDLDNPLTPTLSKESKTSMHASSDSQSSSTIFDSKFLKEQDAKTIDAPKTNKSHTANQVKEPELQKNDHVDKELIQSSTPDNNLKLTQPSQTKTRRSNPFSSKRINACIISSERTRSLCALVIALWVVSSYNKDSSLGKNVANSKSVLTSRPLYILLLTDVTIVLGQTYLDKRGESLEEGDNNERVGTSEDGENWANAIKLMERGLVVYQSIRAMFIDFSIYTVVVICGLALV